MNPFSVFDIVPHILQISDMAMWQENIESDD